jgi:low affinity Fe/Cu permease
MTRRRRLAQAIESFSTRASEWTGSTTAFAGSVVVVAVWIGAGPLFGYSDTWQLVINTITNVVTFVMVFLIQRAQNKDALAMQIKLSELLALVRGSPDEILAVEDLSEEELRRLHARYLELAGRGPSAASRARDDLVEGGPVIRDTEASRTK